MRSILLTFGLVVLLGIAPVAPAFAKTTQYECKFEQDRRGGNGWIPEVVFVFVDDATDEITVLDPVIDHFIGDPIPARLIAETKVRKTFAWEFETKNKGQGGVMFYTMSYFVDGRPTKLSAQPVGYDNSWSGEGSCTLTTT